MMKIAVLTDIHFGEAHPVGSRRRCEIADILMERAVRRLNALVHPDVVLVLGDLVDAGGTSGTEKRLQTLKDILDKLEAPYVAIPGNHDKDINQFYRVFERPADWLDIKGVRFLPFIDPEEPGYNARRRQEDIDRIKSARAGFNGQIVALQHVCLFPPELGRVTPYNYINAPDIIAALKEAGVVLSISGHHHHGAETVTDGPVSFVTAPGLCEAPFPFMTITLNGNHVETQRHELAMSPELNLVDNHLHTQLAYCAENMTVERTIALARDFGIAGITFTEHSGQLYYDRKAYWGNAWVQAGIEGAEAAFNRMPDYLKLKDAYEDDFARFSLEVDCDARGGLVVRTEDARQFDGLMGTVHALPGLTRETPPRRSDLDDFLFLVEAMCRQGVRILAHPLRIFRRFGWDAPPELFEPTARLLKRYNVAAEINFHTNQPPVEFVRCCLDTGVKFSFGSDSHNLAEIGDFAYHIALLRQAGYDGSLGDVLLQ
ncbi:MAG: metallophosphoesterase [Lentisphaeria bacterium]|nr:metallophosphoesterase [Lentisphaeria bacterium]